MKKTKNIKKQIQKKNEKNKMKKSKNSKKNWKKKLIFSKIGRKQTKQPENRQTIHKYILLDLKIFFDRLSATIS